MSRGSQLRVISTAYKTFGWDPTSSSPIVPVCRVNVSSMSEAAGSGVFVVAAVAFVVRTVVDFLE